jgi:hypothetical protein
MQKLSFNLWIQLVLDSLQIPACCSSYLEAHWGLSASSLVAVSGVTAAAADAAANHHLSAENSSGPGMPLENHDSHNYGKRKGSVRSPGR